VASNPVGDRLPLPLSLQELLDLAPDDVDHFDLQEFQALVMERLRQTMTEPAIADQASRWLFALRALANIPCNARRLLCSKRFRARISALVATLQDDLRSEQFLSEYREDPDIYRLTIQVFHTKLEAAWNEYRTEYTALKAKLR
jgi:hypothetical protein